MKTYTFSVASCGTEPRIVSWNHFSKEDAESEMKRKGYVILNFIEEETL